MARFVIRRMLWAIPILIIASILVFVAVRSSTDPVAALARNPRVNPQQVDEYRQSARPRPVAPDAVLDLAEGLRDPRLGPVALLAT